MSDTTSPVSDVNFNTLDELFSRDPLNLSNAEIDRIVAELRARREKWLLEESAPKKEPKAKPGPKKQMTLQDLADIEKELDL